MKHLNLVVSSYEDKIKLKNSFEEQSTKPFHRKIEIFPENGWDAFQLIEFISYMPENFYASQISSSRHQGYTKKMNIFENNIKIFEIFVSTGLEKQKVNSTTKWLEMNNLLMLKVKMVEFSLEKKENHPLIIFGKYFTHSRMSPSPMLRNIFLPLFKRPKNPNNPNDIKNLLKSLPGYIEIIEQEKTGDGLQTSDECELQRLTWVCAWASSRIDDTQYIELDASFKATKPYCYCCVNSILNNESITIALTIGISESSNLYEETYAALERAGINPYVLNKFPVLSDMGVGLYAFCKNRALMQFICHRHIIESFGNKILRNWVRRLLNCATEDEYDKVSILISEEIKIWVSQFKDQNMIPSKIVDIQCMIDKSSNSKLYNYNK